MDAAEAGGLGGTYGGNPLACEAALAVLESYDALGLGERARVIGDLFDSITRAWPDRFPLVGERRGLGAMRALELVRDRVTREPAREETDRVIQGCHARGLIVLPAGTYGNVVRLLVPLVATDDQVREGLAILEAALVDVTSVRDG
jgi:4-aminobutyrate aminotransferase/(S)-3-amino-2-methylpropionate transaminase